MQPNSVPLVYQLLPLIFFVGIFYFLILRPQQKKQKEHEVMVKSLKKNDEVVTIGGIHGTIVNVKEKTFILRIDDNAKVEIDKGSVAYVIKKRDDKAS